ncbi:helix-turn-helix domain-containing protein [Sinorhizobium meliloti]|uniref:helix-turn-helix domain-containing protein n=1 Tax=Rhizobium meliloti TaxID=382 RepID=UPI001F253D51|nr:AraC family transcriptional regulator [Sinorhizobium meliloti]
MTNGACWFRRATSSPPARRWGIWNSRFGWCAKQALRWPTWWRATCSSIRGRPRPLTIHLANADPLVQHFERWARNRLHEGFSLDVAADALHVSKRTLQRRMDAVLGKSPLSYFQDLRVERAVHLLRTSRVTLRTLLRKRLGRGVRELRDLSGR